MLKKFSVENFKNFKNKLELDLTSGKYTFNNQALCDNVIKNSVLYGINGSGKSNLTYAIMDITTHLTDFTRQEKHYSPYLNIDNDLKYAEFSYEFKFGDDKVIYRYKKESVSEIYDEIVIINDEIVILEDYENDHRYVTLKGAENLDVVGRDKSLSFIKYIFRNTKLDFTNQVNVLFKQFKEFVEGMLYFGSGTFEGNIYQGFKSSRERISTALIKSEKLDQFERFLKKAQIHYSLEAGKDDEGGDIINVVFDKSKVNFLSVASHGTKVLMVFFYWLLQVDKIKFLVVDEFDAFYHNEVAINLLSEIIKKSTQSLFTTHNTSIMSNDLLRPDCYFLIQNNKINNLPSLTVKELRFAHNLEKMYNAGAFNDRW